LVELHGTLEFLSLEQLLDVLLRDLLSPSAPGKDSESYRAFGEWTALKAIKTSCYEQLHNYSLGGSWFKSFRARQLNKEVG
jgi:hypothetical protein